MTTPYLKICKLSRAELEAARRANQRRAFRTLLFWVGVAVFGALALCVGLAARGESSGAMRLDRDVVDAIEVGSVYDGDGKLTLIQLVFWVQEDHGYDVADWRLFRPGMEPERRGAWWVSRWIENDRLIVVYARSRFDSWLQYDSELVRREHWPVDRRRKIGVRR